MLSGGGRGCCPAVAVNRTCATSAVLQHALYGFSVTLPSGCACALCCCGVLLNSIAGLVITAQLYGNAEGDAAGRFEASAWHSSVDTRSVGSGTRSVVGSGPPCYSYCVTRVWPIWCHSIGYVIHGPQPAGGGAHPDRAAAHGLHPPASGIYFARAYYRLGGSHGPKRLHAHHPITTKPTNRGPESGTQCRALCPIHVHRTMNVSCA